MFIATIIGEIKVYIIKMGAKMRSPEHAALPPLVPPLIGQTTARAAGRSGVPCKRIDSVTTRDSWVAHTSSLVCISQTAESQVANVTAVRLTPHTATCHVCRVTTYVRPASARS